MPQDEPEDAIVARSWSTSVRRMGKLPVVVGDCPGFLVNRILLPYLVESAWMLEEGTGHRADRQARAREVRHADGPAREFEESFCERGERRLERLGPVSSWNTTDEGSATHGRLDYTLSSKFFVGEGYRVAIDAEASGEISNRRQTRTRSKDLSGDFAPKVIRDLPVDRSSVVAAPLEFDMHHVCSLGSSQCPVNDLLSG